MEQVGLSSTIALEISIKHPITTGHTSSSSTKFQQEEIIISTTTMVKKRRRLCTTRRKIHIPAREESPQMAPAIIRNINTWLQALAKTSIIAELL